jgi:hypothetical protein
VQADISPQDHTRSAEELAQAPASTHDAANLYRTPASSFGIAQEVAENFGASSVLETPTSALPGSSTRSQVEAGPVYQLFDFALPPKNTLDAILGTYLKAVHWFMLLFHEPSFRVRYESLISRGIQSRADSRFSLLLLTIWILGCKYMGEDDATRLGFDAKSFQTAALRHLEANLMFLFEDSELESVQVCVLLGSFYLYTGRPNLGFVVLGSGIRCAFALGLHRESSWPSLTQEVQEERKRVWWALFIFDRFASIVYGHPCGIREGEFEVSEPRNLDDTGSQQPCTGSTEVVTAFTYVTCKIELYRISSPIMTELYTQKVSHQQASRIIHDVDKRLSKWREALPNELRLDLAHASKEQPASTTLQETLMLQALALQVAYDNILILLHRPLLHKTKPSEGTDQFRTPSPLPFAGRESRTGTTPSASHSILHTSNDTSTQRCLDSALRSASICDLKHHLATAKNTHALAYFGINLFTAGMILSTVALSRPLSLAAQQAKKAIRKILIACSAFKADTPIACQTHRILGELVRLILDKELVVLTDAGAEASRSADMGNHFDRAGGSGLQPASGTAVRDLQPGAVLEDPLAGTAWETPAELNLLDGINSLQTGKFLFQRSFIGIYGHLLTVFSKALFPSAPPDNGNGEGSWLDSSLGTDVPVDLAACGQAWLWEPSLWGSNLLDQNP